MTVTGGIKFFEKSKCLYVDGARAYSFNSESTSAQYILNHNRSNGWQSSLSDDTRTEQIVIDLDSYQDINRIILNQHNFKDVTIYLLSEVNRVELETGDLVLQEDEIYNLTLEESTFDTTWYRYITKEDDFFILQEADENFKIKSENFLNLAATPTADTLQRTITETNISTSTSYYDFDTTRCIRIILEVAQTQIADEQKYLKCFIATNELGTFAGFPAIEKQHDRSIRSYKTLSGKNRVLKGYENVNLILGFDQYPGQADHDLIEYLFLLDADFLVWICGGREGSSYFNYNLRGFTIDDLYLMQISEAMPLNYTGSIFMNPYKTALSLVEVEG